MTDLLVWALLAGLALALALVVVLTVALRLESGRRAAAEAALADHEDADARARRLAMLDRRLAAIAPIDALWLGWKRDCRPPRATLAGALAALAEARLVFPLDFSAALDEAQALLLAYDRHQDRLSAARDTGRRYEREEMLEREIELELALRPMLAALRERLAEAARVADA